MKMKGLVILLFCLSLIFVSCLKKGESEIRAAINEMHNELVKYGNNMTRAASSKEVADEIKRYYRRMAELADTFKKLSEKYPELNNENFVEKYKNDALINEVNEKVNLVLEKYSNEPEVADAYSEVVKEMQVDPTVSSD